MIKDLFTPLESYQFLESFFATKRIITKTINKIPNPTKSFIINYLLEG